MGATGSTVGVETSPSERKDFHYIECSKYCMQEEYGEFAHNCTNISGGFFKCCVKDTTLEVYDTWRLELQKANLVKDGYKALCHGSNCEYCFATLSCTIKHKNGTIETRFTRNDNNNLGGRILEFQNEEVERIGYKALPCIAQNYCDEITRWYYGKDYYTAMSSEELCRAQTKEYDARAKGLVEVPFPRQRCIKNKPSFRRCPTRVLKRANASKRLKNLNKELRKFEKKLRKKYNSKKSKKRKKKKCKKNKKCRKKKKRKKKM